MKTFLKTTTTLVLIIIFLLTCMASMFFFFAASWLHTYKSFTREKVVAEIRISELKKDDLGNYVDLEFTPIENDQSAFSRIFVGEENPNPIKLKTENYKLYGDVLNFGGPTLKFKSGLILLNFETAYKLNTITAEYESDDDAEANRTADMTSRIRIGEDDTTYRSIADNMRNGSLSGRIYKIFFDSEPQRKLTGVYVTGTATEGEIVIRNEGFHFVAKDLDQE